MVALHGSSTVEHIVISINSRDIPVGDIDVEGGGAVEHIQHRGDQRRVPRRYVVVKAGLVFERARHCGDAGGIPVGDVTIRRGGCDRVACPRIARQLEIAIRSDKLVERRRFCRCR